MTHQPPIPAPLRAKPSDPALDFCLWPYARPRAPAPGALRGEAMLRKSFEIAGLAEAMSPIADAVQARLGRFATVWGLKCAAGRLSWEFYVYDYDRRERAVSSAAVLDALRPLVEVATPTADAAPWFMFSFEIDAAIARREAPLDRLDLYTGLPSDGVSAGICHGLSAEGLELRNLYWFHDAATQFDDALAKALATPRFDGRRVPREALFWPEMDAGIVVVAQKRQADGLYFSRISAGATLRFLRRAAFPAPLVEWVEANLPALSHHLFDAGYDHAVAPDGTVSIEKGSVYGLL